jgi:hypothetical protein
MCLYMATLKFQPFNELLWPMYATNREPNRKLTILNATLNSTGPLQSLLTGTKAFISLEDVGEIIMKFLMSFTS